MVQGSCFRGMCGVVVLAVLIASGLVGCQATQVQPDAQPEPRPPVNDAATECLPAGFQPLRWHYDVDDPDDFYPNGWPRYIVSSADNMIMAYVPAQTILMGGGLETDEVPARTVQVPHFYMDIHEVTNLQFHRFQQTPTSENGLGRTLGAYDYAYYSRTLLGRRIYAETGMEFWFSDYQPPENLDFYQRYWEPGLNDHHPVRNVSWWDAWHYARWSGKRLPTESQREAAARGDDHRVYPWGNESHSELTRYLTNYRSSLAEHDGYGFTAPVMSYAPGVSPFGIFNLAGNVWEWCRDWYDPGRYAYPSEEDPATGLDRGPKAFGDRNYPNPYDKDIREARVGPIRGDKRVIRGGSFADPVERTRVDARSAARPNTRQHNVGFRCILPLPPDMTYPCRDE